MNQNRKGADNGLDSTQEILRFEVFELDLRSSELTKNGVKIRLHDQPLKLLELLLERPGELVNREEIKARFWPNDTIVDFEYGINGAVAKLRAALSDSAREPRFIETVAKRGYRFVAAVARESAASPVPAAPAAPADLEPASGGLVALRYRIREHLGEGGAGAVYQAEDVRLGRNVALKFLSEELLEHPDALERFRREARAASALNHPNICTIYEIDESAGRPFIAMELLAGQTLRDRIAGRPLDIDEILDLAIQATDALEAAHRQGIAHRDIKPANLFVTTGGQVKILDFGLAKLLPETQGLTRPGMPVGTTAYMSPEQARAEDVDARTDLFSLGAVLHEMATGRQAFSAATPALTSDAILHQSPPSLSTVNPEVPAGLERIVTRLLEKNREQRYATAAEARADLKRVRRERSFRSPAPAAATPAPVMPQPRQRLLFYALALLILGVCAGFALAWSLAHRAAAPTAIHSVAVLPFDNLSSGTLPDSVAAEMMDSTIGAVMRLGNLTVVSRTSVLSYKAAGKTLPEIGRELRVEAVVEGSLLRTGDRLRIVARLVDVPGDKYVWTQTYERDYLDIPAMEDAIAADIARQVASRTAP